MDYNRLTLMLFIICFLFLSNANAQISDAEKKRLRAEDIPIKNAEEYRKINKNFPIEMIIGYEKYKILEIKSYKKNYPKENLEKFIADNVIPIEYAALTSKELFEKGLKNAKLEYSILERDPYLARLAITRILQSKKEINSYVDKQKLSQTEKDKILKDFFTSKYDQRFSLTMAAFSSVKGVTSDVAKSYPEYLSPLEIVALATGKLKSDYYKTQLKTPASKLTIYNYKQKHPATNGIARDRYQLLNTGGIQYDIFRSLHNFKYKYVFNEGSFSSINKQKENIVSAIDGKTKLKDFIEKAKIDPENISEHPTDKQKGLLYIDGATEIYFVVNETPSFIFPEPSEDEQIEKKLIETICDYSDFTPIIDGTYYLLGTYYVFGYREKAMLNNIIEKSNTYRFSNCALIFGGAHDFKKYQTDKLEIIEMYPSTYRTESVSETRDQMHALNIGNTFDNFEQQKDFVRKLFESGTDNVADTKILKQDLTTALLNELSMYIFTGTYDIDKIKMLISDGAELNEKVSYKGTVLTPLGFVLDRSCYLDEENKKVIKLLIQYGTDINNGSIGLLDIGAGCYTNTKQRLPFMKLLIDECNFKVVNIDYIIDLFTTGIRTDESKDIVKYLKQVKQRMGESN